MLKKKSKINLSRSLLSWLRKTSKNVCKEYLRKNPTVFADIDNYSETISDAGSSVKKELPDEIYEFLDKEDADLLFKYINADCNERRKTAERMGITSNALCKRIIKIKRKLQKYLTDNT